MTLLENLLRPAASSASKAGPIRRAIIDIGSNSIRLVIYDGPARAPFVLFNEKIAAGLGAELGATGRIDDAALDRGLDAISRFALLVDEMSVGETISIATAAVREAANGQAFITECRRRAGLDIAILSGEEEARAAGYGVISSIQGADGIVADLGGGSLELARVSDGEVHEVVSLPIGVLRLEALRGKGKTALSKFVAKALKDAGWSEVERDLPLYLVGGSWRALAHLDMQLSQFPLPVIHQYRMDAARAAYLVRVTASMGKSQVKKVPAISSSRAATLPHAAALLAVLVRQLGSSELVTSAFGLREGLLFERLSADERALDPLLVAAEAEGAAQGRFPDHGAQIDRWISPLFSNEPPEWARIRRAACMLADVGWRANPDFRAERGMEIAQHGNWVGIDGWGRAMLAQALYANFGGGTSMVPELAVLTGPEQLMRAVQWGLAIRLAQRLSGGVAGPLEKTRLSMDADGIVLEIEGAYAGLCGETVNRRLKHLSQAVGADWRIDISDS